MSFKLAEAFVEIGGRTSTLEATLTGVRSKLGALSNYRVNLPFGLMGGAAALAAGFAVKSAIGGAADLGETLSKVDTVFGSSAKNVIAESERLGKAFGVNKREYLDGASAFAMMAQGMGVTAEASVELSKKLTQGGIDVKSQMNLDSNEEAWERMRAALRGTYDSIDTLNVFMTEATVTARALAMAHKSNATQLTINDKFNARAAMIMEGLAGSTGDLAKTSGGAANQMAKFSGSLSNLATSVGTVALPAFTSLVTAMNEIATDAQASADKSENAFASFFAKFKSGVEDATIVYRNFNDVVAIAGIDIAERIDSATAPFERMAQVAGAFGDWFASAFMTVMTDEINALVDLYTYMSDSASAAMKYLGDVEQEVAGWFAENFGTLFYEAFTAVPTILSNFASQFTSTMKSVYDWFKSGFSEPIKLELINALDGFESRASRLEMPTLKLPEYKIRGNTPIPGFEMPEARKPLTDAFAQLREERIKSMEKREAERLKNGAGGGAGGGPAGGAGKPPEKAPAKERKTELTDVAGFTAKLLTASLDTKGDKQVKATERVELAVIKLITATERAGGKRTVAAAWAGGPPPR